MAFDPDLQAAIDAERNENIRAAARAAIDTGGQLDWKPGWSFAGIHFVVKTARMRGAIRQHVHEYPHTPGGKLEKMGRKLYEVGVEGIFESNTIIPELADSLTQMGVLRSLWEDENTDDLVIPWVGTIKACCLEWEISEKNTNRSGLDFTASFLEDWDFEFPIQQFLKLDTLPLEASIKEYQKQKSLLDSVNEVFEKINDAANFVFGLRDQFMLYRALVDSKISFLESLFREADATRDELQDPRNILFLQSFGDLWTSIRELATDMDSKGAAFKYYTVPNTMTLSDIAVAIYGDGSRALDLMGLNPIEDPYAIPAGTEIRYYDV